MKKVIMKDSKVTASTSNANAQANKLANKMADFVYLLEELSDYPIYEQFEETTGLTLDELLDAYRAFKMHVSR